MNKLDFISRQFSRAEKKRFEHYVVTRIWHLLNDLSIKFVTQQYVSRPDGRALTDMFFPQLQIHIEIDEGHHKKQIEWDKLREADIINATGHEVLRVDVTQNIEAINTEIFKIVEHIKLKKSNSNDFKSWDIEAELNPKTYIDKGFIDLNDDCAFRTMVDAANCFGNDYKPKGIWTGGAGHGKDNGKIIWFPKLYKNGKWNNSISNDEIEIREICELPENAKSHIDHVLKDNRTRIVFARVKSPLGDIMYRFKGEYELDKNLTNYTDGLLWRRISKSVKTYSK
ncbi:MAG: DUF559 domain-containing protein [Bacteroidia bacterium]|nr:DUF559 domain-containing protein [Bacteroidia bacterium]